jgi:hypothetical protein
MTLRSQRTATLRRSCLAIALSAAALSAACTEDEPEREAFESPSAESEVFWDALNDLCDKAFAGRLTEGGPNDSVLASSELRMHVRECSPDEIRIPFHVGSDRSRTWVVTRTAEGLRLKHDHRHEDGSEDSITQYGGDTRDAGTSRRQEFYADSLTATLIPAAITNVWTIEIHPDSMFAYALRREGTDRRVRAEFDLRREVDAPPPPWGAAP